MSRSLLTAGIIIWVGIVVGCKPKQPTSAEPSSASGYFQTPFQSECQFIVQAIVSDVAEQIYYAAKHDVPTGKTIIVTSTEKSGASADSPVYELNIKYGTNSLKFQLTINGPIWSPQVYQGIAKQLAQAVALNPSDATQKSDVSLLHKLSDGTPETIERENQRLSAALEEDFSNPELHEQAAVLLGAFILRDHSGSFFQIRSPLSRLTAHLVMADLLRGSGSISLNRQMAEAMMLTLVNNEAEALAKLRVIGTNEVAVLPMVRTLQARNTGDYRPLEKLDGLTRVECVAFFLARSSYVSTPLSWPQLSDNQKQTIDFVRAANEIGYSVEIGHQLLAVSVPLEIQEIQSVYKLSHSAKLNKSDYISALNALPENCFSHVAGEEHVRVIGWGQWADFLQRHLCHAVQQNFDFMYRKWGVPEDAKEFAAKCDQAFDGLRLYPFVRRFNCTDDVSYKKAVDDGFKVTIATPHLVPSECWNYLCFKVNFAPQYNPNPNPHVNEWHSHNPPPGTVYDFCPRLNHPSLVNRGDIVARFEQLHEMAPSYCPIIYQLIKRKYNNQPSAEQVSSLLQAVMPYSIYALRTTAWANYNQPDKYQKIMLQAAELDPTCYYDLSRYEEGRHEEDLAMKYLDQGCAADPDSVRVSNKALQRVQYYLKRNEIEKARQIADEAGEVYSAVGLEAKASFLDHTKNYEGAFEWYAKIEERYDNSGPLIAFCERYKKLTGDTRFDLEVKKRAEKIFSNGIERVTVADLHGPPSDGVLIKQQNSLLTAAGLRAGDVIVALAGTRTHTFSQYLYVRGSLEKQEMDLIVWQGSSYREIKASPPNHKFGVDFGDYRAE